MRSAITCTFKPCSLCFPEWKGRSAAILSIGNSVPSRITNALAEAAFTASASVGAKEARTSTASATYR